jgi:hypothetical protein
MQVKEYFVTYEVKSKGYIKIVRAWSMKHKIFVIASPAASLHENI